LERQLISTNVIIYCFRRLQRIFEGELLDDGGFKLIISFLLASSCGWTSTFYMVIK